MLYIGAGTATGGLSRRALTFAALAGLPVVTGVVALPAVVVIGLEIKAAHGTRYFTCILGANRWVHVCVANAVAAAVGC